MKYFFFFFFYFLSALSPIGAQQKKVDSLLSALEALKEDTNKANMLNALSRQLASTADYDQAAHYAGLAKILSEKNDFKKGISNAYNNIGNIYYQQGNYDQSLKNHIASLKIREEARDKKGIADSYSNIGNVYFQQGNDEKALENYLASLKIREEIGDKRGLAVSYTSIGNIYYNQSNYDKARENYFASLKTAEEIGDKQGIANSFVCIGNVYDEQGNSGKTLENYFAALLLFEELGDKRGIAATYINIGIIYLEQGKTAEAKKQTLLGLSVAKEIGSKDRIKESYWILSLCDSASGNWKDAYGHHALYSQVKDSLLNEESSKQIAEMATKYDTEKKEQKITLLNKDKQLQDSQLNRQKIIIWSVVSGLLIVVLLSVFIFRERKKSEKLLLNILPAETARELKANGKATAKQYGQVTVMFTDFKGFTTIAEKLSAEDLVSELDFLFRKFDEIISKYPIEKIKTIGDAYMCAGGLPSPNTTNALDIVNAAIEIQGWMQAQNNKWSLRVGIHTGPVTAGVVGDKKFAYDIWGDAVNTASRMESSGEAGKINISGTTYELIKEQFKCEFRGKIPAKNKGDIEMYFVESTN